MQTTLSAPQGTLSSKNMMWWATMLTAVLAIPSLAAIVVAVLQPTGVGAVAVFMLSCWACVYFGMKLMRNPKITFPYMLEQVQFTDEQCNRNIQSIGNLATELENWKRTYNRCDVAFMNISKQPAWDHLDELAAILGNIRQSIQSERTARFEDLKALNNWLLSPKPATIDAYINGLRGVFAYGAAVAAEQGRDLCAQFPELEKGMLVQFEQTPARMKAFAWEFISELRKRYPFVAAQLNFAAEEAPRLKLAA